MDVEVVDRDPLPRLVLVAGNDEPPAAMGDACQPKKQQDTNNDMIIIEQKSTAGAG
jgi:hypothetical protein